MTLALQPYEVVDQGEADQDEEAVRRHDREEVKRNLWEAKKSFVRHYFICLTLVGYSSATHRLSPSSGLDWELYYILLAGSCGWMLLQAVFQRRSGARGGITAFAEASCCANQSHAGCQGLAMSFPRDPVATRNFCSVCFSVA